MSSTRILRAKCGVVGDATVGKTALIKAFEKKHYFAKEYRMTIPSEITVTAVPLENDTSVELYLVEAGSILTHPRRLAVVQQTRIILFCYDVTNRESYVTAINHYTTIKKTLDSMKEQLQIGALVACKSDRSIDAVIPDDEASSRASELGLLFFSTSAASSDGIEAMFKQIAQTVADKQGGGTGTKPPAYQEDDQDEYVDD